MNSPTRRANHTTRRLVTRFLADPDMSPDDLRGYLRSLGLPRHRVEEIIAKKVSDAIHR